MPTRRSDNLDTRVLVAQERRRWRADKLLAPQSLDDFQERAEAAFRDLRRKHSAPAGAGAGINRRRARASSR